MEFPTNKLAEEAYARGGEYFNNGFYENALIEINKALRYEPLCIKYLYSRMVTYDNLDKLYFAILDAGTVIQLDKNCVWAYEFLGYAHSEMGEFGSSKVFYEHALRLQPTNSYYAAEARLAGKKYLATLTAASFANTVNNPNIVNPYRQKFTTYMPITDNSEADVDGAAGPSTSENV